MWGVLAAVVNSKAGVTLDDLLANIGRRVESTDEEMMVFARD